MKRTLEKIVVVLAVVLITITALPITAVAATSEIELQTRSALLVDRSGSVKDQQVVNSVIDTMDKAEYDFIGYFDDSQISLDAEYQGGGNSAICETIDEVAKLGYTHIAIVTDGEQWPKDYTSLGAYTDLDLTFYLVGDKDTASSELIDQLKSRLINSSLKVVTTEGEEQEILNDYKNPVYTIEVPEVEEEDSTSINEDKTFIDNIKEGNFPWWLVLILAAVIAALFDFIHELITKKRDNRYSSMIGTKMVERNPVGKGVAYGVDAQRIDMEVRPLPIEAVDAIVKGTKVLADYSGSMARQQKETAAACKKLNPSGKVICFGEEVSEVKASEMEAIKPEGSTHGWEAIQEASAKGCDNILIISDMKFNGRRFDKKDFARFKKITVVVPNSYSKENLANLREIADEVEVLPL